MIYAGDSMKYDVRSAEEAGTTPVHFDPFGLCHEMDHAHVGRLVRCFIMHESRFKGPSQIAGHESLLL